jgi:cytochrome c-type biogenesis protein
VEWADLTLALATGLVAAVNPCGFALLPAYLTFLVVADAGGRRAAVTRALTLTAAMTAGFVGVFGLFGLVITPVAGSVAEHLPWVTVVIGLVLVALGGWLLAGRSIPGLGKVGPGRTVTRSWWSMVAFGGSYALASLGCTIGPFLAVVGTSFSAGDSARDFAGGLALFVAYGLGMGATVGIVAVAVALARTSLVTRLRRAAPVISRAGGLLLVLAGAYVAYYGVYEVRVFDGGDASDPVVDAFGEVQSAVAGWLDGIGVLPVLAVFGVLVAAVVVGALTARRTGSRSGT